MFTQEEKEKAKYFKFSLHPQDELQQYLNPRFLSIVDENSPITPTNRSSVNIPKQIVLFWHNEQMPEDVRHSIDKIKQYNPDHQIELFHTESAGEFIKQYYGNDLYTLYERRCVHPAMKSDLFRMCYLAHKGGIYVDVDIDCFGCLEEIFRAYQFDCLLFYSQGQPSCIDNDFIVCQPNNFIIMAIVEKIQEHLTVARSFSSVWECTGPGAVSMVILELLTQNILADISEDSPLKHLQLGNHTLATRAYGHIELEYKKTMEGNWRRFRLPRQLYQL